MNLTIDIFYFIFKRQTKNKIHVNTQKRIESRIQLLEKDKKEFMISLTMNDSVLIIY